MGAFSRLRLPTHHRQRDVHVHSVTCSDRHGGGVEAMDPAKYEFKSDFAKRYLAEGRTAGYAEVVLKQMSLRFGELSEDVMVRVRSASLEQLECYAERILTAERLEDVLGA